MRGTSVRVTAAAPDGSRLLPAGHGTRPSTTHATPLSSSSVLLCRRRRPAASPALWGARGVCPGPAPGDRSQRLQPLRASEGSPAPPSPRARTPAATLRPGCGRGPRKGRQDTRWRQERCLLGRVAPPAFTDAQTSRGEGGRRRTSGEPGRTVRAAPGPQDGRGALRPPAARRPPASASPARRHVAVACGRHEITLIGTRAL